MKCLLYCTKAKPLLINFPFLNGDKIQRFWTVKNNDGKDKYQHVLNGFVCFECDCKEALLIPCELCDDGCYRYSFVHTKVKCDEFFRRSHLLPYELDDYSYPKSVYAFHLENVKPIEPMPITQLYKDEDCTIPLTKAPQSYCFAYQKCNFFDKKVHPFPPTTSEMRTFSLQFCTQKEEDRYFYSRKVLIFSIKSPWLCKIANGEKDLEVRKTRIQNAGIEYK